MATVPKTGSFPKETIVFLVFTRQPFSGPIGEGFRNAEDDRWLSMRSWLGDSKLHFLHSITFSLYFVKLSFSKVKTPLFQRTIDSDRAQCTFSTEALEAGAKTGLLSGIRP